MSSPIKRARARRPSTSSSPADRQPPGRSGAGADYRPRIRHRLLRRQGVTVLTLRSSPSSPFVRKVRIAASVLGLDREIGLAPADTVRLQNPLGKIPSLVLEDGTVLFDSRVILEYLDHRAGGGRIIPTDIDARLAALRLQALADGIMDASVLLVYEGRWRAPERH